VHHVDGDHTNDASLELVLFSVTRVTRRASREGEGSWSFPTCKPRTGNGRSMTDPNIKGETPMSLPKLPRKFS